jgi:hypothetical protein
MNRTIVFSFFFELRNVNVENPLVLIGTTPQWSYHFNYRWRLWITTMPPLGTTGNGDWAAGCSFQSSIKYCQWILRNIAE